MNALRDSLRSRRARASIEECWVLWSYGTARLGTTLELTFSLSSSSRHQKVIPGVDIRCHAFSHQYRVIKAKFTVPDHDNPIPPPLVCVASLAHILCNTCPGLCSSPGGRRPSSYAFSLLWISPESPSVPLVIKLKVEFVLNNLSQSVAFV